MVTRLVFIAAMCLVGWSFAGETALPSCPPCSTATLWIIPPCLPPPSSCTGPSSPHADCTVTVEQPVARPQTPWDNPACPYTITVTSYAGCPTVPPCSEVGCTTVIASSSLTEEDPYGKGCTPTEPCDPVDMALETVSEPCPATTCTETPTRDCGPGEVAHDWLVPSRTTPEVLTTGQRGCTTLVNVPPTHCALCETCLFVAPTPPPLPTMAPLDPADSIDES